VSTLYAGSASREITPIDSQFLFGYPHVERYSTGVHDKLLATALYLESGDLRFLFIGNDIIFVGKESVAKIRPAISRATGIPASNIMISATHTHSGPGTVDYISNEADEVVPRADPDYVKLMEARITEAGIAAVKNRGAAELSFSTADGTGVGTNRRSPSGASDLVVPVLVMRKKGSEELSCIMLVCSMHPTVMHEDSTLISGDFPGMTREYLQNSFGENCAILYNTGCEGNQSPRHITNGNTFDEARRIGYILGKAVEGSVSGAEYQNDMDFAFARTETQLIPKKFPAVEEAAVKQEKAIERLQYLRTSGAPRQETRTAECDWFGSEETLTLAKAQADGRIASSYDVCMPAEIEVFRIGPFTFVTWPGEIFIEHALVIRGEYENTYVINLANGELQGYIVTQEAAEEGGYEASNGLFAYESGDIIVQETKKLLTQLS
jgi:neutral ceramidase